jgi:membrane protease YdiL (CAAX protease family)
VSACGLWLRVCVGTALAATLLVTVAPHGPRPRLPFVLSMPTGALVGGILFALAVRAPVDTAARTASLAVVAGKHAFFGLLAADEEIVWRRVALGALLPRGLLLALVASTATFALAHRRRVLLHFATGGVFGTLYLATGSLAAPIGAHWTYNELVARARFPAPS